jgi:chromosome segregation ATPase
MSQNVSSSASPSASIEQLRRELEEKTRLVQDIRKELILAQITVLELQDTVLQKETDKADAVSILGQSEHALEGKINYIVELDRVLNEKIASLQSELAAVRAGNDERDRIIQELVQKLDLANREIGATHTLAGNYARDLARAQEALNHLHQKLSALEKAR